LPITVEACSSGLGCVNSTSVGQPFLGSSAAIRVNITELSALTQYVIRTRSAYAASVDIFSQWSPWVLCSGMTGNPAFPGAIDAPEILSDSIGPDSFQIQWTIEGVSNGGTPIRAIVVQVEDSLSGIPLMQHRFHVAGELSGVETVSGLHASKEYRVRAAAENQVGQGPYGEHSTPFRTASRIPPQSPKTIVSLKGALEPQNWNSLGFPSFDTIGSANRTHVAIEVQVLPPRSFGGGWPLCYEPVVLMLGNVSISCDANDTVGFSEGGSTFQGGSEIFMSTLGSEIGFSMPVTEVADLMSRRANRGILYNSRFAENPKWNRYSCLQQETFQIMMPRGRLAAIGVRAISVGSAPIPAGNGTAEVGIVPALELDLLSHDSASSIADPNVLESDAMAGTFSSVVLLEIPPRFDAVPQTPSRAGVASH